MTDSAESAMSMNDELPSCKCAACQSLATEYQSDAELLELYRRKLLIRGWAGRTSPTEKAYILAHAPWAQRGAAALARHRAEMALQGITAVQELRPAHVYNPQDQERSRAIDVSQATMATSATPTGPGERCEIELEEAANRIGGSRK